MSGKDPRIRKRDRILGLLQSRTRSPSVATPSSNTVSGPAQAAASPPTPPSGRHPDPPITSTSAPQLITLDLVLERLTEEQKQVICGDPSNTSSSIVDAFESALRAAEQKQRICINKRWTLKVGTRSISLRDKAAKVIELVDRFKNVGSIVAGADPIHAGLPWAAISLMLQVAVSEKQQMDALLSGMVTALSMKAILDVYLAFYEKLPLGLSTTRNLAEALVELYATILRFLADASIILEKNTASRFWHALSGDGELQKFASSCKEAETRVETAASNCDRTLSEHDRMLAEECKEVCDQVLAGLDELRAQTARIELNTNFAKLPRATTAAFDSTDEERLPRCLENTRVELQDDIERWVNDANSTRFFWLQGVAGTGKSTVARTIAQTLQDHDMLGASFFFKRSHAERGNADLFFATIAVQLAQRVPGMESAVAETLSKELGVYKKGVATQFSDLVASPLRCATSHMDLVILVDALDECDDDGDRKGNTRQVLQLLYNLRDISTLRLRLLVTSRLEFPVEVGFAQLGDEAHRDMLLHEIPRNYIERDIQIFIKAEFQTLRHQLTARRRRDVLGEGWPGDDVVQDLSKRSAPLFIFASTVCLFVADVRFTPQDQLKKVLHNRDPVQLSSTYLLVLESMVSKSDAADGHDEHVLDNFRKIVGFIIFSAQAPSIQTIAELLDYTLDQVEATLDNLHSVLDVTTDMDRPVRPFHLSFIEFLARPKQAHEFQIDELATHEFIASKCLVLMMRPGCLRRDMCGLRKPGTRRSDVDAQVVESHISPALAYACRQFVHHQSRSGALIGDSHEVHEFLRQTFLYWFEAMAWLGRANDVLHVIQTLKSLAKGEHSSGLTNLLTDAYYFARDYRYIANEAPLQLYASALVFAPECSVIKSLFEGCMPAWLVVPPEVPQDWDEDAFMLNGHEQFVSAITFSPDSQQLVTCSFDGKVRIWTVSTGECARTLSHDEGCIPWCSAFIDDTHLAIGFYIYRHHPHRAVIIVYDTRTWKVTRNTDEFDIASPEDTRLTFAPGKNTTLFFAVLDPPSLHVWRIDGESDAARRAWTYSSADVHEGTAYDISGKTEFATCQNPSLISCFLPADGGTLYPAAGTVVFWDVNDGAIVQEHDTSNFVGGVVLEDADIDLSHTLVRDFRIHTLAISKTRDKIAFADDRTNEVQMRRISRRNASRTPPLGASIQRHASVVDIIFTLNGRLMCVAYENCIKVWNAQSNVVFAGPEDMQLKHDTWLQFSSDGTMIAVGTAGTVRVWNVGSGREVLSISESDGVNDRLTQIVFSSDNKLMFLKIWYGEILVWDIERDERITSFEIPGKSRYSDFVFSDDAKAIISSHSRFNLVTGTWDETKSGEPYHHGTPSPPPAYSIGTDWICFDREDLLWIPSRYRTSIDCVHGTTVALGHKDGRVTIMKFTDPANA